MFRYLFESASESSQSLLIHLQTILTDGVRPLVALRRLSDTFKHIEDCKCLHHSQHTLSSIELHYRHH